jgi:hypothetical protein
MSGTCRRCPRNRIKGFERANKRTGQEYLYFDAPSGRDLNCLRETKRAWVKARAIRPVGHHLQLSYSLRNRWRREGCADGQWSHAS